MLFGPFRTFQHVGQGVGQNLTHTLTHNVCGVFVIKKHRKPKLSMLFGAGGVTQTHNLLITKRNDKAMRLICVIPFEEQATKWTPQLRDRYFDMLADCNDISCVDYQEKRNAQFLAYQITIKRSDMLLAIYDLDLASGSVEDKAISLCPCTGKADLADLSCYMEKEVAERTV